MGCHTWFGRPLLEKEVESLIPFAYGYIEKEKNNPEYPLDPDLYANWKKGLDEKDIRFICDLGSGDNFIYFLNNKPYLDLSECWVDGDIRFQIPMFFHDDFRVSNYPRWLIHNKRQLRRKMKKKYFDLTQDQLDSLSLFWKMYPGGIIHFG